MKKNLLLAIMLFLSVLVFSQEEKTNKIEKKGWSFGALPAISYNTDVGLQYGGLVNFFNYGDGKIYPKYYKSIYLEISRTTKGSGINRMFFDSEHLIPNIRTTFDFCYLTEKALDFYGFNGYETKFNQDWVIDDPKGADYRSRLFYRNERKITRFTADFQGGIIEKKFRWVAGFAISKFQIGSIDINNLNSGKSDDKKLPTLAEMPGLYERYISWGLLSNAEKDGGNANYLKLGLVYDTRDFEANPSKGMWSEIVLVATPSFLGNPEFSYSKFSITHRQYFSLINEKLTFVYRLNYQGTLAGKVPFYMQSQRITSFMNSYDYDGLGGAKTLRGIIRDRIVGDGIAYGNLEFRWKFLKFATKSSNWYLGLNTFLDGGMVVKRIDVDITKVPSDVRQSYFDKSTDAMHYTFGGGLRVVMNENFIVACDYGKVLDKRDGTSGLYIGLNYLF